MTDTPEHIHEPVAPVFAAFCGLIVMGLLMVGTAAGVYELGVHDGRVSAVAACPASAMRGDDGVTRP